MFADDIMLYKEDPKDSTRKLLELMNEFGRVVKYKINTQKSPAFLYTNNNLSEDVIKKTIPFIIASRLPRWLSSKESTCRRCKRHGGDSLEEEMSTHSSILAWKTPWTEEPGRL